METVLVEAFVDLPEVSRGRVARLERTTRVNTLIQRGFLLPLTGMPPEPPHDPKPKAVSVTPASPPVLPLIEDLDDLTVPKLRILAESLGLDLPGYVRKADLVEMLTEAVSDAASGDETLIVDLGDLDEDFDAYAASEGVE